MENRIKRLKYSSILAIAYQAILVISGLLLPRLQLQYFGSEVNGLLSSISQFLAVMSLCDMGIGAVVSSALYKPLAEKDWRQVGKIFAFSKRFFKGVGVCLCIYVAVLLLVYPQIVKKSFGFGYTIFLIGSMSISQITQYYLGMPYQLLLSADQRDYVQLTINGFALVLNTITSSLIMISGGSIHLVKLITSAIYLIRPALMHAYVHVRYEFIRDIGLDRWEPPQKRNGIVQHFSYIVNANAATIVLTITASLRDVSVYSVYLMIVKSMSNLISAATTGVQAYFGNLLALNNKEQIKEKFEIYEWIVHWLCTVLFTITGMLITSFVAIYTKGISDANYYNPFFAVMMTISYGLNCIRNLMYSIVRAAGQYKQTQTATLIETGLNLVTSVVFVLLFGLLGVAIGMACSSLFYIIYEAVYFSRNVVHRSLKTWFKQIIVDIALIVLMIGAASLFCVEGNTYYEWFASAVVVTGICTAVSVVVQFVCEKKRVVWLFATVFRQRRLDGGGGVYE